jgi:hypothetical protein
MANAAIQGYLRAGRAARRGRRLRLSPARSCSPPPACSTASARRRIGPTRRRSSVLGAVYVRDRYVVDGKLITGGGVSSGIDMALALAARLTDEATARRIQLGIEYDPRPPFGPIDWSRVGAPELERQRQGGTGRRLKDAPELLAGRPDLLRRLGSKREP